MTNDHPNTRRTEKTVKLIRGLLAAVCIAVALYGFLKITDVQIAGNVVYSKEDILAASGLKTGRPLLLARGRAAERAIESGLPAVEEAEVRLRLPGTVTVDIREGTAVAAFPMEDGRIMLLSAKGKVVGEAGSAEGYVSVKGISPDEAGVGRQLELETVDEEKLSCLIEILTLLDEGGTIQEVRELDVSNLTSIRMNYADRFQVRLGGADRLGEKLKLLGKILEELSYGETGIIDLSRDMEGHYIPR